MENRGAESSVIGSESISRSVSLVPQSDIPPVIPYKRNLLAILLLGVLICWWVFYFTDWFDAFVSLLALGGIFSWVAFMAKILPTKRIEEMQDWFDKFVLTRSWVWKAGLAVAVLLVGLAACFGTIQVNALRVGGLVRIDKTSAPSAGEHSWESVSSDHAFRFLAWSPPWHRTEVVVKVGGLPARMELVQGLRRLELQAPDSFRRPVLLLRSTVGLAQELASQPKTLLARYHGDSRQLHNYAGQAVWVNCDPDVEVPAESILLWRAELGPANATQLLSQWTSPVSFDRPDWKIEPGEQLQFELRDEHNQVVACAGDYTVRALPEKADARQVGVLDVKETSDGKCVSKSVLSIARE